MSKQTDWKNLVNEIFETCQDEIKRTTAIGKKMIAASRTNGELNESFEELGKYAFFALKEGTLHWEDEKVSGFLTKIETLQNEISEIEGDVQNIKFPKATQNKNKTKVK